MRRTQIVLCICSIWLVMLAGVACASPTSLLQLADDTASTQVTLPSTTTNLTPYTGATNTIGTDMAAITSFVSDLNNQCKINETRPNCFIQLIAHQSDPAPINTLACPTDYVPIFQYGNTVMNADWPNIVLTYTAADSHDPVTWDEYNYYLAYSYTCGADQGQQQCFSTGTFTVTMGSSAYNTGQSSCPEDDNKDSLGFTGFATGQIVYVPPASSLDSSYNYGAAGTPITANGYPIYITNISNLNSTCNGSTGDTLTAYPCNNCTAATYWSYNYQICGQWLQCTRAAGFNPANQNGDYTGTGTYPLAQQASNGSQYSPSIMICGKNTTNWEQTQ